MTDATQLLGPKLLTTIETTFINKVNLSLGAIQGYASTILFAIAALELALFGLAWVIKQDESLGILAIKVLKIGFIYMVISYFPYLLQQFIDGFTQIAFQVADKKTALYVFRPGEIWKLGLKGGVTMLKLSVEYGTYNVGISFIYLILGFGTLIIFALIGAQVILVVGVFYAMAIVALLLVPFGVLKPFEDILQRAIQGVFKASVRVFGLILVLGVGYTVWEKIKLPAISVSTGLETPLAFFISSLVILVLVYKLPAMLTEAVGKIKSNIFEAPSGANVSVSSPPVNVSYSGMSVAGGGFGGGSGFGRGFQSATGVASGQGLAAASNVASAGASQVNANVSSSSNVAQSGASLAAKGAKVEDAASINKSISDDTLRKLKTTVKQAMNDKS